jgi:ribokinase
VAVVGSINADLTVYGSPLPRPGETVTADRFSMGLGGKGANQAVAAARAGVSTHLIGAVGKDVFRDLTLGALAAEGVNTDAVAVLAGHTGVAHIRVDSATGQNDIAIVAEANARMTAAMADDQLRRLAGQISVVLLQLETPLDAVVEAARAARAMGCRVILDPAPAQSLPDDIWPFVDVVTPNETEAEVLTGIRAADQESAVAAGTWFLQRGAGAAIVTLAERGVVVVGKGKTTGYPAFAVQPVDTTAAGDAFTGSLGAALAQGIGWEDAVHRALAAGALAVTVAGASPSLPTAAQVDAFLTQKGQSSRS